jgi:hypothetical protein
LDRLFGPETGSPRLDDSNNAAHTADAGVDGVGGGLRHEGDGDAGDPEGDTHTAEEPHVTGSWNHGITPFLSASNQTSG